MLLSANFKRAIFTLCLLVCFINSAQAQVRVAVASNFASVAKELAAQFEKANTGDDRQLKVSFIVGSTGKHAAQILQGLNVDLLLAADVDRPSLLEQRGLIVPDSRITYAIGNLVFWRPLKSAPKSTFKNDSVDIVQRESLSRIITSAQRVAVANAKLAPYGQAAFETLEALNLELNKATIISGENIAQTYQFVHTGNVEGGFVARSQTLNLPDSELWMVPSEMHQPIEQQMVLLSDHPVAKEFYQFIKSIEGMAIIRKHGYDTP